MEWEKFRLHTRLNLKAPVISQVYDAISQIDGIKNSWKIVGKLQPQTIARLTQTVIITSTGASNRIEGNILTDKQVEQVYRNLQVKKLKTRDEQEVAGYLKTLELIFSQFEHIPITESTILQIHNDTLKHSHKDTRHKGRYKTASNRVEAKDKDGNIIGTIFEPTAPFLVEKEMRELIEWYHWALTNKTFHPLILIANFIFEYLAIHPFQDGNGRTSRLLTNLMLLQNGYEFTHLVSHEKIIEANKLDYYIALNKVQKTWKSSNEDISAWLLFFLSVIKKQADKALQLIETENIELLLSEKQLALWQWAQTYDQPTFSRKDAIEALGFSAKTVESCIKKLLQYDRIERIGQGSATRYKIKSY